MSTRRLAVDRKPVVNGGAYSKQAGGAFKQARAAQPAPGSNDANWAACRR
jgi:hypothetical protein